jgi:hypothetical protein
MAMVWCENNCHTLVNLDAFGALPYCSDGCMQEAHRRYSPKAEPTPPKTPYSIPHHECRTGTSTRFAWTLLAEEAAAVPEPPSTLFH